MPYPTKRAQQVMTASRAPLGMVSIDLWRGAGRCTQKSPPVHLPTFLKPRRVAYRERGQSCWGPVVARLTKPPSESWQLVAVFFIFSSKAMGQLGPSMATGECHRGLIINEPSPAEKLPWRKRDMLGLFFFRCHFYQCLFICTLELIKYARLTNHMPTLT